MIRDSYKTEQIKIGRLRFAKRPRTTGKQDSNRSARIANLEAYKDQVWEQSVREAGPAMGKNGEQWGLRWVVGPHPSKGSL